MLLEQKGLFRIQAQLQEGGIAQTRTGLQSHTILPYKATFPQNERRDQGRDP